MNSLDQALRQLLTQAKAYPERSWQRQQKLSQIYRLVMKSGKLWRENTPYYNDALQEMWEYCCAHLEEYDPQIKEVITWLDDELKKRIRRFRDAKSREKQRQINLATMAEECLVNPVDTIASPVDIEPVLNIWQETLNWVQSDPDKILCKSCFRKRSEINCQVLFLKRFPEETPWKTIAEQFLLTSAEAKDLPKWYNRCCLKLIREFGKLQGYIEEK